MVNRFAMHVASSLSVFAFSTVRYGLMVCLETSRCCSTTVAEDRRHQEEESCVGHPELQFEEEPDPPQDRVIWDEAQVSVECWRRLVLVDDPW